MTIIARYGSLWWLLCAAVVAAVAALLHLRLSPLSDCLGAIGLNNDDSSHYNNDEDNRNSVVKVKGGVCGVADVASAQPLLAVVIVTYKR